MIGLANSCKEYPNRHYYSSGAYECAIVQNSRLNADNTIPGWCPLPDYPAAPIADSAMAKQNEGEQSMQDACATLPDGYLIEVNLENGAGWVDLYHDGEKVEFDEDTDDGMTGRIRAATA
ncbi:hypothetical protein SB822_52800, partial [Paraburkholderia sp. SIMBA_054]